MNTQYDLQKPPIDALSRSQLLAEFIRKEIESPQQASPDNKCGASPDNKCGASISFARFMALALYHPALGYYNNPALTLGQKGDFTTAAEISPLYAHCFAYQALQIFTYLHHPIILELGAGSGAFAANILLKLEAEKKLPEHYFIYDVSVALRKKQYNLLKNKCPHLLARIHWLDKLPENFIGLIIANEVLDAQPVHCFRAAENTIQEKRVSLHEHGFTWHYHPANETLRKKILLIHEQYSLPNDYESEINLDLDHFMQSLAAMLEQGIILFADYGYPERLYYHPERNRGTLTCFYQHHYHQQPFLWPGLQDISAHVNFSQVIERAANHGFELSGYTSQSAFLLSTGLMEFAVRFEQELNETQQINFHHAIKLLTFPTEMGERIKIMALHKNMPYSLTGFAHDRSYEL